MQKGKSSKYFNLTPIVIRYTFYKLSFLKHSAFRFCIIFLFGVVFFVSAIAQPRTEKNNSIEQEQLAYQYYQNAAYDKAAELFEGLMKDDLGKASFYRYYFNCLLKLQDFKKIERFVKKEIKLQPTNTGFKIDLAYSYLQAGKTADAKTLFENTIKECAPDRDAFLQLSNQFKQIQEIDLAIKTLEKGLKTLQDAEFLFAIGELYKLKNDFANMQAYLLECLNYDAGLTENIQGLMESFMETTANRTLLKNELYKAIQKNNAEFAFTEMLIWLCLVEKDYEEAFVQTKALDKRSGRAGTRLLLFANTMAENQQYEFAAKAYQNVVTLGPPTQNRNYYPAMEGMLRSKRLLAQNTDNKGQLQALEKDYETFIAENSQSRNLVARTIKDLAYLEAYQLGNTQKAIDLLENLIAAKNTDPTLYHECKIDLGDYYLYIGDYWEATLLYAQVDKALKDAPLGEMARYKNAKLSYYMGQFTWAQAQMKILKAATSDLIANDALNLSVFITDNLGLDTTSVPMEIFAKADLCFFQNKTDSTEALLDTLLKKYPGHGLTDDIYYLKAKIFIAKHQYTEAVGMLENIMATYKTDILADDALYLLAGLYQLQLNNPEKAKTCYQQILTDYPGSTYVVEAREKYRALRGDKLN